MSHFSLLVNLPASSVNNIENELAKLMAPYNENIDECPVSEFIDMTQEAHSEYATDTVCALRFPDGHMITALDEEFRAYKISDGIILKNKKNSLFDYVELPDQNQYEVCKIPVCEVVPTFEAYCSEYCGYQSFNGQWGYFSNPNAEWDWWEIGGRFCGSFLVDESEHLANDVQFPTSRTMIGCAQSDRWVSVARKGSIKWAKMKEIAVAQAKSKFSYLEADFRAEELSDEGLATITEDGIVGWGNMLYIKDETYEQYLARNGLGPNVAYPVQCYAYMENGTWNAQGNMGWFGLSSNDKEKLLWVQEVQHYLERVSEDDILMVVDCHI